MKNSEELFIEQLNRKQHNVYHQLFSDYYRSLVMFAMRYIDQQEEAEDIVQDLFVTVWEKEENFLSYNSFRVFLYNSVRNTCLNKIKHHKVEEKYVDYTIRHTDAGYADDWEFIEEELYRQLFRAIEELPPRCREVFLLHLDGKKNEEIATELHITLLTVKTQKKKAMLYLRERLGRYCLFLLYLILH